MKKILLFVSAIVVLSCHKEQMDIYDESVSNEFIKTYTYFYHDDELSVKVDFSNPDQPKLLDGADNTLLENILELPNLVTVVNNQENLFLLFDDREDYENSQFYSKRLAEIKTAEQKAVSTIPSATVTFYNDINFKGPTTSFTSFSERLNDNLHPIGFGDKISSVRLRINNGANKRFANLGLYEDTRYRGKSLIFYLDASNFGTSERQWNDLRKYKMNSTPWSRSWNDRISSFSLYLY